MASGDAEVRLYLEHIKVVIAHASDKAMLALAHQIEAQTKANIVDMPSGDHVGLVDTGFLLNSVYAIGNGESGYGATQSSGEYVNRAGETVRRERAPEERLPRDAQAAVVVGANYAIYQEVKHSFLFKAAEQVAQHAGGTAERVYREEVHD